MKFTRSLGALLTLTHLLAAHAGAEPATGLADSAALRATVYGTPPQDIAPLPAVVPLDEIDIALPWARPLPAVLWFDRRLRAWFSAQSKPAPLAIVISGTGDDGNTAKLSLLRATLYGAGYHVLTLPSPTNPGFIAAASSTGVAGDLMQDSHDLYAAAHEIVAHLPARVRITDVDVLGYSLGGAHAAVLKSIDSVEHRLRIHRAVMINPPVSLFAAMNRLDQLFALSVGPGEEGIDRLYRRLYVRLANFLPRERSGAHRRHQPARRGRRGIADRCRLFRGDCADVSHRTDECVLCGGSVCRHGRGYRSAAATTPGRSD